MLTAVVLRHVDIEGPGLLEDMLKERSVRYEVVDATELDITGVPKADIMIAMGGPWSANDNYAWVNYELAVIKKHVEAGKPYFGICLGAQMLARAMGGRVVLSPREVGGYEMQLTGEGAADPLFAGLEGQLIFPVFHWHGETVIQPPRAVVLARSRNDSRVQMFRILNAIGMQPHWQDTEEMVKQLIEAAPDYLNGVTTPERVMREFKENYNTYSSNLKAVFGNFLEAAAGR